MRSRRYDIPLHHQPKTISVIVYADRSVEMYTYHHEDCTTTLRPESLQTREEAAWVLAFSRRDYAISRTNI